ncbi:MAG TPA: NADH-quinone oxidoreductase subunit NuoF, partial [Candidatus Binatia bacterium]|nr:NADH-quinone oxidoreductase subunit NuoF [Candidatus Binatia bacterium]
MEKVLLRNVDVPDSHTLAVYSSRGGYRAWEKVVKDFKREQLIEEVKASGLRGRGGAGFPTGMKWSFVPKDSPKPKYLICNADESEPGTFKDRLLIEKDPHAIIEGTLIAAYAIQSHTAFIYIRGELAFGAKRLEQAVHEVLGAGYIGKNIMGSGYDLDLIVHKGAGAYICGEETALLSSLEGSRGWPKVKPPFPATHGLFGCPTVVNNVETLAALPWIIEHGAAAYAAMGTDKSKGTKLFSVSGHISKPGVYELEMGYPLMKFLEEDCGGVPNGKKLKGVIPGGGSMPVLRPEEIEKVNLDYESVQAAGSLLGSGGVIVMDDSTCMVRAALNLARFFTHESCGQCTPCREGCHWMEKIFRRIEQGEGQTGDLDLILDVSANIMGNTICPFGDAAAMPAAAFI